MYRKSHPPKAIPKSHQLLLARVSPTIRVEFSWIRVSCSLATGVPPLGTPIRVILC